jgi:trk system potassium uptake protein TrkA
MNMIVIGCGRVGAALAYLLYKEGHQVTVVDEAAAAFDNLLPDFRGRTVEGDVLAQDTMHRAGIEKADGLAVVTPFDSINAVVAHVASSVYHVPNVVVRNYDPRERPLLESFGHQVVSPSIWGSQRIAELLSGTHIPAVFSSGNGEVEVYEFTVPATWEGRTIGELLIPGQCLPVALVRAGRAMLPTMETQVQFGDVVDVSATEQGITALRAQLGPSGAA